MLKYTTVTKEDQIKYLKDINIGIEDFLDIYIKIDKDIRCQLKGNTSVEQSDLMRMFKKLMKVGKEQTELIIKGNKENATILKSDFITTLDNKVTLNKNMLESTIMSLKESLNNQNVGHGINDSHEIKGIITELVSGETNTILSKMTYLNDQVNNVNHVLKQTSSQVSNINNLFTEDNKKGKTAEKAFTYKLQHIYGSENIHEISNINHTCDISINLPDKPKVLLEIKNYNYTVPTTEVNKFLADCEKQKCCGIFASMYTDIAKKDHFTFDIKENRISVFLHYTNYQTDVISMALTVIYGLHNLIVNKFGGNMHLIFTEQEYYEIKIEYQNLIGFYFNMIANLKKMTIDAENQIHIALDRFFSKTFSHNIIKGVKKEHSVTYVCTELNKKSIKCTYNSYKVANFKRHMKTIHNIILDTPESLEKYINYDQVSQQDDDSDAENIIDLSTNTINDIIVESDSDNEDFFET
jgi:hypothetical protein